MSTVNGFQVGSETLKYNYESLENYNTPEFSTTKTYAVGDYVIYQGKLYKCTTAVTTAGSWSSSNWALAVLSDDVSSINNAIDATIESGWDNNFNESGYIVNGVDAAGANFVRTSKYYDCSEWAIIYVRHQSTPTATVTMVFYDENMEFVSNEGIGNATSLQKPSGACYFRVYKGVAVTGLTYISNEAPSNPIDYSTKYALKGSAFSEIIINQADNYNAFDNNFDASGYINNGADAAASAFVRTSKYYDCSAWENIFVRHQGGVADTFTIVLYDSDRAFVFNVGASNGVNLKKPNNVAYFRVYKRNSASISYISYAIPSEFVDYNYSERQMMIPSSADVTRQEFLQFKSRILDTEKKTVVNFGDSIIGNTQDDTSVSGILSALSGYNCVNVGFGGCRMSKHTSSGWDAFSMCLLADAIVSGNWSAQDTAIAQASTLNLPGYFSNALTRLKAIDFSEVYMITIEYGTNDWSGGVSLDNPQNAEDINTYAGALRYSIKKLQTAYPKLKIVVQNPIVRIYPNTGETSDTVTNALNLTLVQYVNTENDVCRSYKIPVIDAYYKSGFNIYNHDYYYSAPSDDVHLGYNGRFRLAEMIASFLLSNYR